MKSTLLLGLLGCCALMNTSAGLSRDSIYINDSESNSNNSDDGDDAGSDNSRKESGTDKSRPDSITLSSGYFEGGYSNNQLARFGLELLRAGSRIERYFAQKNPEHSQLIKCASWVINLLIQQGFWTAYHETGHGLAAKAYGLDYQLLSKLHDDDRTFKKDENFFKFFSKSIFRSSRAECRYNITMDNAIELAQFSTDERAKAKIRFSAGGMNNEMRFAELLTEELYEKGNLTDIESFVYFAQRLLPAFYAADKKGTGDPHIDRTSGDDPVSIGALWELRGISARRSDIGNAGLISMLLSGTTYSIFYNIYTSNKHGTPYSATPLRFHGFRIPDTFAYISPRGMTYKFVSSYQIHPGFEILFGYETVVKGQSANEFNLGVRKVFSSLGNTAVKVVTTFGEGFNGEASIGVPLANRVLFEVGGAVYSKDSLLGERNIRRIKYDKKRCYSGYASISILY